MSENDNDLPLCMQEGWDPTTPGKEYEARILAAMQEAHDAGDEAEVERLSYLLKD